MLIYWTLWAGVLAVVMATATWMEYNAILRRINGANGFVLLMAGIACAASLPLGGAIAWYYLGFTPALKVTLVTAAGLGAAFCLALYGLSAYAGRRG